jgi:hypothetical protein
VREPLILIKDPKITVVRVKITPNHYFSTRDFGHDRKLAEITKNLICFGNDVIFASSIAEIKNSTCVQSNQKKNKFQQFKSFFFNDT